MIGPMLGAVTSLAGVLSQAGAQQDTNNLNWANLFETKRVNRKNEKLATATRKDANGNIVQFNDALGEWEIIPSPTTKQILEAEERETLKSLTEDAPRNRAAAVRKDERSKMGDEEFEKAFNEYKYRPKKSEAEYTGDAQRTLLLNREKGMSEASSVLARELMRTGNTSRLPEIYKAADDLYAGTLEEAMLKGKSLGMQQFGEIEGNKDARLREELGFLQGIAGDTTTSPVNFTNKGGELTGQADDALAQLLATISQGEGRRMSATGQLAQSMSQSPDFGGLASALAAFKMPDQAPRGATATGGRVVPYPRPYEEGVRARMRANGF